MSSGLSLGLRQGQESTDEGGNHAIEEQNVTADESAENLEGASEAFEIR